MPDKDEITKLADAEPAEQAKGEGTQQENQDSQQVLEERIEEMQARYTRLAADFDNYKKRAERQSGELILRANQALVCSLLPILDNFLLALGTIQDEAVQKGVRMIYDQLTGVLGNEGLAAIDTVGIQFDPVCHEAVAYTQSAEADENVIVEEIRKGYTLGGKVIRPALVKVNINKEE